MDYENKIFTEFDAAYTHDKTVGKQQNYQSFNYTMIYSLHGEESKKIYRTVYCRNEESFNKLLAGWNSVDARWKFFV